MQPDQLRKLTRKWAIPIILITILGALGSYLVSKRLTPTYQATGRVLIVAAPGSAGAGTLNIDSTEATTTAASLLTEPALLQKVINALHLHTNTNNLSTQVSATAESNTELVDVTVSDPSPTLAANITNSLMNAYVVQVTQANQARIDQGVGVIQQQLQAAQATLNQQYVALNAEVKAGEDTPRHAALSPLRPRLSRNSTSAIPSLRRQNWKN